MSITAGRDPRITRVGQFLRQTKLDELPQLINVLKGDMSLVGPRPEVPRYVELFREDYEEILQIRPGITDLASLKYRDEAAILGQAENPEEEYVKRVLPEKIRLAKDYMNQSSLYFDIMLIFKTLSEAARVQRLLSQRDRSMATTDAPAQTASLPIICIEPSRGWISLNLRELWEYRELLYFLVWRDVKVRYKQTAIGAVVGGPSTFLDHADLRGGV